MICKVTMLPINDHSHSSSFRTLDPSVKVVKDIKFYHRPLVLCRHGNHPLLARRIRGDIMSASAVSPLSWRGRSFLNQAYDPAQSFAYTSAYSGVRAESTAETSGTPEDTGPAVNTPRSNHYFNIFSRWLFNNDCTCSSFLNLSYLLGLVS